MVEKNGRSSSLAALTALVCVAGTGYAQQHAGGAAPTGYPNKPIRLLVGFPPGGGSDATSRFVSQKMSEQMGTNFVVENRPGAGGVIAMQIFASSFADGYTMYFGGNQVTTAMVKQQLASEVLVDVRKKFIPVVQITTQPYVMIVNAGLPIHSVKDLIEYAKKRPGELNHSSSGIGAASHMQAEYFKHLTGIKMTHVPYKGTSAAAIDLVAGRVHMAITNVLSARQNLKIGKTRALAVTSPKRSPYLDLPTLAEAGVPGFEVTSWYGFYLPTGTPPGIVNLINREATRAVNSPEVKSRMAVDGSEAVGPNTPADFRNYFLKEIDKWTHFAKVTGVKPSD